MTENEFVAWRDSLTLHHYVDRLLKMKDEVTPGQWSNLQRMLVAQYLAPGRSVTVDQLAQRAGINVKFVKLEYGRLGHLFCEPNLSTDNSQIERADHRWRLVWSDDEQSAEGLLWTMRPQVAEALELLGWVSP